MRRILSFSLSLLLLLCLSLPAYAAGDYFGSRNSNVYHRPGCGQGAKIHIENMVWFSDADEAVSRGYRPCDYCKPPLGAGPVEPDPTRSAAVPVRMAPTQPKPTTPPATTAATEPSQQAAETKKPQALSIYTSPWEALVVIGSVFVAVVCILLRRADKKEYWRRLGDYAEEIEAYQDTLRGTKEILRRKDAQIAALQKQLSDLEASLLPVPAKERSELWQDCEHPFGELTVYVSFKGQRFHRDLTCRGLPYGAKPVLIHDVPDWIRPCPYCARDYQRPKRPTQPSVRCASDEHLITE